MAKCAIVTVSYSTSELAHSTSDQQNTESTQKTILSVLSWAGDAYHWQLRAMEPAWGPEASKAFSQVATRLAIRGNTPKAKIMAELYGHLSLLLVRANA